MTVLVVFVPEGAGQGTCSPGVARECVDMFATEVVVAEDTVHRHACSLLLNTPARKREDTSIREFASLPSVVK